MRKLFTLRTLLFVLFCIPVVMTGTVSAAVGDAGVSAILAPSSPVCRGSQSVDVIIENFGGIAISTVTVNWSVNGVTQTPYSFTGTIAGGGSDTVSIGSFNFTAASNNIAAATSNPNGSADNNPSNDTAQATIAISQQLTGQYTIGGASPDYPNFNAAVSALATYGVCGPVTFNIRPGTDTLQSVISQIAGVDSVNTITFQSQNGDSSTVVLTYPSSPVVTPTNYLIRLDGADYITFSKITMQRSGIEPYARVVELATTATHNKIMNCRIIGSTNSTTNSLAGLIYSSSGSASNDSMNVFMNNNLTNGSLGIYMNGIAALNFESGTTILNNTFTNQTSKGVQMTNQGFAIVTGNTFTTNSTYPGYVGIYLDRSQRSQIITKNKISSAPGTGIYMVDCTALINIHGIIANNFVHCSDSAGVSVVNCDNQDIVYNSILMTGTTPSFSALFMRGIGSGKIVKDNLLVNTGGGYAYVVTNSSTNGIVVSDYNNLFTTGTNVANYDGADEATINNLITVSQKDSNSISVNPNFASSVNLHVTSIAMDDRGNPVSNVFDDIDGQIRSTLTPDIGADEYASVSRNVGVTGIANPSNNNCGDSLTHVSVVISNPGGFAESNFSVVTNVTGPVTTTLTQTYAGPLAPGASDTLTYTTPINTSGGGSFHFHSYTSLTVDDVHANDTLDVTVLLTLPPSPPTSANSSLCGPGRDTLNAASSDTIRWYSAPTGGTLLFTGPQFITPVLNATTTYYAVAKSGCESSRVPVTVTVFPVPSVTLGPDTNINQGAPPVVLNAGSGFTSYLWSTGATTPTISVSTTGCYSVRVTNSSGCTASDTICVNVILPNDVGIASIVSPVNLNCADDSTQVLVNVSNFGSNPATNIPVTVNITGSLNVTLRDTITASIPAGSTVVLNLGLINTTGGDTIVVRAFTSFANDPNHANDTIISRDTIRVSPPSPIAIGGSICGAGNIVLIGNGDSTIYYYDSPTGGNLLFVGNNYNVGVTSTTTFYIQDGNICNNQARSPITATVNSLPNIFLGNDTVVSATSLVLIAGAGFTSYSWSTGQTTPSITVTSSARYSVCVTDSNGCTNCDSITVNLSVGVQQLSSDAGVSLFPNPAHSSVTLKMNKGISGDVLLHFSNLDGQIVSEKPLRNISSGASEVVDLSGFAQGVYYVKVTSQEHSSVYKLIVQ